MKAKDWWIRDKGVAGDNISKEYRIFWNVSPCGSGMASDKRRAAWMLTEAARKDIDECFRSRAAAFLEIGINAKTGSKIMDGVAVKKDSIKDFTVNYLEFLEHFHAGTRTYDSGRHHESDIKGAIGKYLDNDGQRVKWHVLAIEIEETEKTAKKKG